MKEKKIVISFAVDKELLKDVDLAAYKSHMSRSAYIRSLLYMQNGRGDEDEE